MQGFPLDRRVNEEGEKFHGVFEEIKAEFSYYPPLKGEGPALSNVEGLVPAPSPQKEPNIFSATLNLKPKKPDMFQPQHLLEDDSLEYIMTVVLKEFLDVIRGYQFDQYDFLTIKIANTPLEFKLTPQELEQYRKKKIQLITLLKQGVAA